MRQCGWCPSSSVCGVLNGGGVCCCWSAQCGGVALIPLIPLQYSSVLRSCHAPFIARCVVCVGGDYLSEVFVWWGILRSPSPRHGGGWGHHRWWGGIARRGGMVSEGRVCDGDPPVCVLVSPFSLHGGRVEGRGWCVLWCPCSDWVWRFALSCAPLYCPTFNVFAVTVLLV